MELQTEKRVFSSEVSETSVEMKAVYDEFLREKEAVKKEHRLATDAVLRDMDERRIKELKEELEGL